MRSLYFFRFIKLSFIYFRFYFLNTVRNVPALFFTLVFPALIFVLSIHVWGGDPLSQRTGYLTFANYSVQTVCFMLLGMGVSQEKNSNWSQYARTLPAPLSLMISGRILHTIILSFMNVFILTCIAVFAFHISLSFLQILSVFFVCAIGAVPFAMIGITIGYLSNAESARSIFTILNLLFFFGSFGISKTGILYKMQEFILSYQWVKLQKSVFDFTMSKEVPLFFMLGYFIVFSLLLVSRLGLIPSRKNRV